MINSEKIYGVMVNELECDIEVNEFELRTRIYVHVEIDTLGKVNVLSNTSSYGLNSTIYCLSIRMALNNPRSLICH